MARRQSHPIRSWLVAAGIAAGSIVFIAVVLFL